MIKHLLKVIVAVTCLFVGSISIVFAGTMDDVMLKAVANNDMETVKTAIANGANVNYMFNGETPLSIAVNNNNFSLVQYLIVNGADVNTRVKYGSGQWPPLYYAIKKDIKIVQLLIDAGADVNVSNKSGATILTSAISNFNVTAVQLLISRGANVNAIDNVGGSPLIMCAYNGVCKDEGRRKALVEMAKILLDAGANPVIIDNFGKTALQIATERNFQEMVDLLNKY